MKAKGIGYGNDCPKCRKRMVRFEHPEGWKPKAGRQSFKFWDRCFDCKHIQHYEVARQVSSAPPTVAV